MTGIVIRSSQGVTLVGGGELQAATLAEALMLAPVLVAADGGADLALAAGHVPEAVIGDLDSIGPAAGRAIPAERIHRIAEQDTTDFDKCLRSIAAPFVLALGFTGARIDHALSAFNVLARHEGTACVLVGPDDICLLAPSEMTLDLPPGTRVSLFPMAKVTVRTTGLRWPTEGLEFAPDGRVGTSNEAVGGRVTIVPSRRRMLVILPRPCLRAVLSSSGR